LSGQEPLMLRRGMLVYRIAQFHQPWTLVELRAVRPTLYTDCKIGRL
jgi:hypothetical protein